MFNVFTLSEYDRELAIAEKVFDIAMSEAHYIEAMIDSKLKINLAKSELKVMQESSEENYVGDLAYLFNEAAKEAEGQNESFFAKAKQAIVNFCVSVVNAIQKLFTGKNMEKYNEIKGITTEVEVDGDIEGIEKACDAVATALESGVAVKEDDNKFMKVAKILGVTAAGGLTIAAVANKIVDMKNTKVKLPANKVAETEKKIGQHAGRIASWVEKAKCNEVTKPFMEAAQKITGALGSVVSKAHEAISKVIDGFNTKAAEKKDKTALKKDNQQNKKTGAPQISMDTSNKIKQNEKYSSAASSAAMQSGAMSDYELGESAHDNIE